MDLGFETIGNATLICHDRGPLLATDPWLFGTAYFGSWALSHRVPEEQLEAVKAARYVWLSHGHPDHLSPDSLELLRDKPILLADHYGGRIERGLREQGFQVRVLETGVWTELSPRVRVLCVPEYCQDSILFVSLDGTLVVDANDAKDRGGGDLLRREVARHRDSWLLCLTGHGDADMINVLDEQGRRYTPAAAAREPLGPGIAGLLEHYGIRNFVPFSAMHRYNRTDSAWANELVTHPSEHGVGFVSERAVMHPPFARVDLVRGSVTPIDPPENAGPLAPPEEFGDDWAAPLRPGEPERVAAYFRRVRHLASFLDFVAVRVGGAEHVVELGRGHGRGISFEAPRASLMTSVDHAVFDDLLIGNFARTTLHGDWPAGGADALHPDFTPFVTKYGDNGCAWDDDELRAYFAHYARTGLFGPGPTETTQRDWRAIQRWL